MEKLQIEMKEIKVQDRKTFRILFDTFFPRACAFAARLLNDERLGEDVAQETFVTIWESAGHFPNLLAFKTYFYTILKNKCLNHLKLMKDTRDVSEMKNELADKMLIDQLIIEEEIRARILQEIYKLPDMKRKVMLLRLEGKSYEEISREMELSINTVKTHKKESYKQLRIGLSDMENMAFVCLVILEMLK